MTHHNAPNAWTYSAGIVARPAVLTPTLIYRPEPNANGWVRPRPHTVRLCAWENEAQNVWRSFPADFARLRYQIGRATFTADVDLTAGVSMAALMCDALDVSFFNGDPNAADRFVSCAVTRGVLSDADARVARRTVSLQIPAVPLGGLLLIPQGATQLQLTAPTGSWELAWIDSAGNSPSRFTYNVVVQANAWRVDVPGGSQAVQFVNNPTGLPADVSLTWRTPL
jgi:hypothetical protein